MHKHGFSTIVIASAALALAFTVTAEAQNSRSFVATTGNDANACSATAYCRTFARALLVTNSGGEIVVVNSGGYGAVTIAQPVTITAIGIDASVTATSGNALTINTPGNVTITGLNLFGAGTGNDGVLAIQVGVLRLYNMQIQNFAGQGIEFGASGGNLDLEDSKINDCDNNGLLQHGGQAYVHNSVFNNNEGSGVASVGGLMTITDSSAQYNQVGFVAAGGAPVSAPGFGTVSLFNDRSSFNMIGMGAFGGGALYFADCLISGNISSYIVNFESTVGTMFGSSPGTSLITPGQTSTGSLGTAIVLQ